jgi:hypothetical protein
MTTQDYQNAETISLDIALPFGEAYEFLAEPWNFRYGRRVSATRYLTRAMPSG